MAGVKGKSGGKRKGAGRKAAPIKNRTTFKEIEKVYDDMQTCDNKDLPFPAEISDVPGAKEVWDKVLMLDKQSKYKLLSARHTEILKSYCLAVAMRNLLVKEFISDKTITYTKAGEMKVNPLFAEIDKKNKMINAFAEDLGLTVLSSYKMAVAAKNGESLDCKADDTAESGDDLFD